MKKKRILTEEQKAQRKIYIAKWKKENPNWQKEWHKKNPDYVRPCVKENPDYQKEWASQHDLGYWVVYLIKNYNGLGDTYCGQTQNIYNRMKAHKSDGRLNTETYKLIKQCETLKDALEFEAYMHEQGYHGSVRTESGK